MECVSAIHDNGVYRCPRCNVTNTAWKSITGRNCLACAGYATEVFCRSCHGLFVTALQTKCATQTQVNLVDYLHNTFFENKVAKNVWPLYTAWLLLQFRRNRTLLCFLTSDAVVVHPPAFLLTVWKRTAAQGAVNLEVWRQRVQPVLQALAPYTDENVSQAQEEVTLFHKDLVLKDNKLMLKGTPQAPPLHLVFPVLHRTVVKLRLEDFILDSLAKGTVTRLFLSHANETMYYLSYMDSTPIITALADLWTTEVNLSEYE